MTLKKRSVSKSIGKWFILAAAVLISASALSMFYGPLNDSSVPQPTPPIPEFPSFAVLFVLMSILVVAVLVYRKKYAFELF